MSEQNENIQHCDVAATSFRAIRSEGPPDNSATLSSNDVNLSDTIHTSSIKATRSIEWEFFDDQGAHTDKNGKRT